MKRLALLAAVISLGMVFTGPQAHAAFPGRNGLIAFERTAGKRTWTTPRVGMGVERYLSEIFVVNSRGRGLRELTPRDPTRIPAGTTCYSINDQPSFSANGKLIVFRGSRYCGQACQYSHLCYSAIFIIHTDGSHLRRLVRLPYYSDQENMGYPSFFPDGRHVLYDLVGHLAKVGLDGLHPDVLPIRTPLGTPAYFPVLSPNGAEIAFSSFGSEPTPCPVTGTAGDYAAIFTVSVSGSTATQITHCSDPDVEATFSPSGAQIVFDGLVPSVSTAESLFVMNSDGSGLHEVAHDVGTFPGAAFSPDGRMIVFGARGGLFVMKASGSDVRRIASLHGLNVARTSWGPA